jgi:hypothetical protein
MINENKQFVSSFIFYGIILLLLWPLFSLTYIFTHDGPAHVYNACLISRIISGNALTADFINLKSFPEPNWTGHFIISAFSTLIKPNVAEKIFLGLYIILFPVFFRRLLKKINNENRFAALLVLPFIFSYFFFGGLYNFLAGVTALFAGLSIILPLFESKGKRKYYWILGFSILLYFSHLLAFGVFVILIALAHAFTFTVKKRKEGIRVFLFSFIPLFLSLAPSLLLAIVYFSNKTFAPPGPSDVTLVKMFEFLLYISSIITFQYYPENKYALVIFCFLTVLLITSLIWNYKKPAESNRMAKPIFQMPLYWALASGLMLLLFFIIPDQAATGGVIKFRFELFFFLFVILWISSLQLTMWQKISIPVVITGWIVLKYVYFLPIMKSLNEDAKQAMKITSLIQENSILLPLNYSNNWMHTNLFNYTGTVKNILVLDNYEAGMPHFPLEWKKERNPVALLGNFNGGLPLCADINNFEKNTKHNINYIVTWNYNPLDDSCSNSIKNSLDSNYLLILNDNDNLKLYQRK